MLEMYVVRGKNKETNQEECWYFDDLLKADDFIGQTWGFKTFTGTNTEYDFLSVDRLYCYLVESLTHAELWS